MKQMPVGAFKAPCLAVMKNVQATGEPVVLTRRGEPMVKVLPVDRVIGATALAEGMVLVTKDTKIRDCKQLQTLW